MEKGIETVLYSDDEMKAVAALRSQVQQALAGMGMPADQDGGGLAGGGGEASAAAATTDGTKCISLPG